MRLEGTVRRPTKQAAMGIGKRLCESAFRRRRWLPGGVASTWDGVDRSNGCCICCRGLKLRDEEFAK